MNSTNSKIEKINTFKALVEEIDENIAIIFLKKANWDEIVNKK
jgi:hypothetical protein